MQEWRGTGCVHGDIQRQDSTNVPSVDSLKGETTDRDSETSDETEDDSSSESEDDFVTILQRYVLDRLRHRIDAVTQYFETTRPLSPSSSKKRYCSPFVQLREAVFGSSLLGSFEDTITGCLGSRRRSAIPIETRLQSLLPHDEVSYLAVVSHESMKMSGRHRVVEFDVLPNTTDAERVRRDASFALQCSCQRPGVPPQEVLPHGAAMITRFANVRVVAVVSAFGPAARILADFLITSFAQHTLERLKRVFRTTVLPEAIDEKSQIPLMDVLKQMTTLLSRSPPIRKPQHSILTRANLELTASPSLDKTSDLVSSASTAMTSPTVYPRLRYTPAPSQQDASHATCPQRGTETVPLERTLASSAPHNVELRTPESRNLHSPSFPRRRSLRSEDSRVAVLPQQQQQEENTKFPTALTPEIMESLLLNVVTMAQDDIQRKLVQKAQMTGASLALIACDDVSRLIGVAYAGSIRVVFAEECDHVSRDQTPGRRLLQALQDDGNPQVPSHHLIPRFIAFDIGHPHTPDNPEETQRLERSGATITDTLRGRGALSKPAHRPWMSQPPSSEGPLKNFVYTDRAIRFVNGEELPVTRALGYLSTLRFGLSPVPDLATLRIPSSSRRSFLIVASAQLWTTFDSTQSVVDFVAGKLYGDHPMSPEAASMALRDEACDFWSKTRLDSPGDITVALLVNNDVVSL